MYFIEKRSMITDNSKNNKNKKSSLWYVVKVVFKGICSLNNFMDKIRVLNICFQDTF